MGIRKLQVHVSFLVGFRNIRMVNNQSNNGIPHRVQKFFIFPSNIHSADYCLSYSAMILYESPEDDVFLIDLQKSFDTNDNRIFMVRILHANFQCSESYFWNIL